MMTSQPMLLLLLAVALVTAAPADRSDRSAIPNDVVNFSCEQFLPSTERTCFYRVIEKAVTTYAVAWFADNNKFISIDEVDPLTPSQLFKVVYDNEASAINMKKTLMTFKYSGIGQAKEVRTLFLFFRNVFA